MATDFQAIVTAIETVVDDQASKIDKVYPYERSTLEGFPALIIAKSDNDADFGSTQNDKIGFVFKLRVYYLVPEEGEHADAELAVTEAIDELLTIFRVKDVLGSACDWVNPVPSVWYYEMRSEAVYRVGEITLNCTKYVA